ncbi:MAG: endonuclease, partial [Verrucomicrobiota bacterium]
MAELRAGLDRSVPAKRTIDRNILIATWNIRAFGGITDSWISQNNDSPKRNWRGMHAIAEIISRFDVVAIQEIKRELTALRSLVSMLGSNWSFLVTDVSQGIKGNSERMGFVFDQTRVSLSGLAGELAAPDDPEFLADLSPEHPFRQFARTPYAVSFNAGHDTFTLVTMHVIFGNAAGDRT